MVSQMFQNTKYESSAWFQRESWFFSFFAGMVIRYRFISRRLCNVLLWICLLYSPWFLWPSSCAPWVFIFLAWRFRHPYYYAVHQYFSFGKLWNMLPMTWSHPKLLPFLLIWSLKSTAEVRAALLCCGQVPWLRHMGQSHPNLLLPTSFWWHYAFKS